MSSSRLSGASSLREEVGVGEFIISWPLSKGISSMWGETLSPFCGRDEKFMGCALQ
jgi:hypothetical protein